MSDIELKDTYTMDLYNKNDDLVAKLTYNFVLGAVENEMVIDFSKDATDEDRQRIAYIAKSMVVFTYGGKNTEAIKMRTYKPGTLSHFVSLKNKFVGADYRVVYSASTEKMYQEIVDDLYE